MECIFKLLLKLYLRKSIYIFMEEKSDFRAFFEANILVKEFMISVVVFLNAFDMIVIHLYHLFPASLYKLANHSRVTFAFICIRNCTMKNVLLGLPAAKPRAVNKVAFN